MSAPAAVDGDPPPPRTRLPWRRHQPLTLTWPPLRCRIGLHPWWSREVLSVRRPTGDPPESPRLLCTLISHCGACPVVRHEQNVAVPRGHRENA